ncbi:MAG: DUF5674 family protein [Patescibacteria group bacterium]
MFEIQILEKPITVAELRRIAAEGFGDMIKAVVDIENGTVAIGGELHVDIETTLMEKDNRASHNNIWGINIYPDKFDEEDFIEFDSMINLKPALGNRTRGVGDAAIKEKIREIVGKIVIR